MMDTLQKLKQANKARVTAFGHGSIEDWNLMQWACAVAGETGELCNLVKKMHRGDFDNSGPFIDPIKDLGKEAADIVIYLDLLCQRAGIDLQTAIVNKFNEVSERVGSPVTISLA